MSPIAPRALLSLLRICTNAGAGRHVAAGPEAVKQRWPERVGIIRFLSNGGWAASGRRVGGYCSLMVTTWWPAARRGDLHAAEPLPRVGRAALPGRSRLSGLAAAAATAARQLGTCCWRCGWAGPVKGMAWGGVQQLEPVPGRRRMHVTPACEMTLCWPSGPCPMRASTAAR